MEPRKRSDSETARKDKLLEKARKRFQVAEEAESEARALALDDLRFAEGDQWPDAMRRLREAEGRPCLTMNRIPQFTQLITNEQRQNPISGTFDPVGDSDVDTGEVLEGLARHIENQSNADEAYSNAFEYAVKMGWGWWRLTTDYSDEFSFDQELYIKRIENPFCVYTDPGATENDASDANWGFITGRYTKDQYKEEFPNSELCTSDHLWGGTGDGWTTKDDVRVAEYFYRDYVAKDIVQTNDGQVYLAELLDKNKDGSFRLPAGMYVTQQRKTDVPYVKWALFNGHEVLEEREWPGKWIPLIRVVGIASKIDGRRIFKGIVRDGRDAQMSRNLRETATTEAIAMTPKAPYIVTPKMVQGFTDQWETMSSRNRPYLFVNEPTAQSLNGGIPYRSQMEAPIQALMMATRQSDDDLKATVGIYDPALGNTSRNESGKAINLLQGQTQVATYHFSDNQKRSIKHTYRVMLDMFPYVYNTERVVTITKRDGSTENVKVNMQKDANGALPPGVQNIYDLSAGKYAVSINTGPSYQTKRQQAQETQIELMKVLPNQAPFFADIAVGNMDIPGNKEIAERLKTMLPAPIQALEQKQAGLPPEFAQQFAQMKAQLQQAQQALQAAAEEAKFGMQKTQMELESKERIAFAQLELDREKVQAGIVEAEIAAHSKLADADAQREMDQIQQAIDHAHEVGMAMVQHDQAQQMQQQQQPEPAE